MNRCASLFSPARPLALAIALVGVLATVAPLPAAARNFPRNALRGKIAFGNPPAIKLNGDAAQLAPGARIHGINNMLILTGQLVGVHSIVDYTLDFGGQVSEVWLLSDNEADNKPWPKTAEQAAAWSFDPAAQTWTKP
jgi:hypothetical protein